MKKMIISLIALIVAMSEIFLTDVSYAGSKKEKNDLTFEELNEIVMKLATPWEFDGLKYHVRIDLLKIKLSLYF